MQKYYYKREIETDFDELIDDIDFSLKKEWFWIVSKIDLKNKIKEKLWEDIDEYIVLGTCNPSLIYDALKHEDDIWLLIPCNIVVYKKWNKTFVWCVVPSVTIGFLKNEEISKISKIAEEKLKKVVSSL